MHNHIFVGLILTCCAAVSFARADFADGMLAFQQGSYDAAFEEWQHLAKEGHVGAQVGLGLMYATGKGVVEDDAEAENDDRSDGNQFRDTHPGCRSAAWFNSHPVGLFVLGTIYPGKCRIYERGAVLAGQFGRGIGIKQAENRNDPIEPGLVGSIKSGDLRWIELRIDELVKHVRIGIG